jgi:hypothetical protein
MSCTVKELGRKNIGADMDLQVEHTFTRSTLENSPRSRPALSESTVAFISGGKLSWPVTLISLDQRS